MVAVRSVGPKGRNISFAINGCALVATVREGFGLMVTEASWKGKPVIGGDTGGIPLQVINHHTGFLVNTPKARHLREYLTLMVAFLHGVEGRIELDQE